LWFASNGVDFFLLLVVHDIHTCKQTLSYFECINYFPCAKFVITYQILPS